MKPKWERSPYPRLSYSSALNRQAGKAPYEPSHINSRLFLADYSRASFDLGITLQEFLQDFNPMFRKGEELLAPYITELPQPEPGHARILFINNSSLPFTEAGTNPPGVMHKAISSPRTTPSGGL